MTAFDLVLRGGSVLSADRQVVPADVGVAGNRIVEVGRVPRDARVREDLDVEGHLVLPGFIDTHVHADGQLFDPAVQLACLRQGVTTVIIGQDGLSFAPSDTSTLSYVEEYFGSVNGRHPAFSGSPCSVANLLSTYDLTTPINVGYLAPHGTIRHVAQGLQQRPPTADELDMMRRLLSEAIDQGALGLSTGLAFLPGGYAETDELRALCQVVASSGGVHVTHMRGYDDHADVGMDETVEIGASTGCRTHVSHYHGPGKLLVDLADEAVGKGVDLSFDSYPYPSEEDVREVMRHPLHMAGSDGIYTGSHPHPRGWGTFARFLGRHTRELGDYDWPDAVRHLSTAAVRRFGLGDRGEVREGAIADLAVVDPVNVRDTATYDEPRSLAVGVPHVVVGGSVVLRGGQLTGAVPGRSLRRVEAGTP